MKLVLGSPLHESVPRICLGFKKVGDPGYKLYSIFLQ